MSETYEGKVLTSKSSVSIAHWLNMCADNGEAAFITQTLMDSGVMRHTEAEVIDWQGESTDCLLTVLEMAATAGIPHMFRHVHRELVYRHLAGMLTDVEKSRRVMLAVLA